MEETELLQIGAQAKRSGQHGHERREHAALSRETFVARESSPTTTFMHERIGTRGPGLTEEEIVDALMGTRWGEEWTVDTKHRAR